MYKGASTFRRWSKTLKVMLPLMYIAIKQLIKEPLSKDKHHHHDLIERSNVVIICVRLGMMILIEENDMVISIHMI